MSEKDPQVRAIEEELAATRADLADTVDRLTDKLDVKGRAADRLHEAGDQVADRFHALQDRATDDQGRPTPTTLSAGGVAALVAVGVVALVVWRRRR